MATKKVAKRKLSDVTFEHEGAHVALTSKDQGYSANGKPYALVTKSNYSKEVIEKIQQVRVTLELPEFLRKFFGMWYEDAEVLAAMLGYVKPEDDSDNYYEEYIKDRLESFEILKSLHESDNQIEMLASLDGEDYLKLLKDQAMLEKAFEKNSANEAEEGLPKAKVSKTKDSGKTKTKEKPSTVNKGKTKMDEIEIAKQELAKANEALDAQKKELEKALEQVEAFKAAQKAQAEQVKFEKLKAAVKDEEKAKTLFKSMKLDSDEEFDATVKVLSEMQSLVEKSALFEEKGLNADEVDAPTESAVAKIIKSKHQK